MPGRRRNLDVDLKFSHVAELFYTDRRSASEASSRERLGRTSHRRTDIDAARFLAARPRLHHAGSGNLDRRGIGDIDTLTVREFLALPKTLALIPLVPASDRYVRRWAGVSVYLSASAADGTDAQWLAAVAKRDGDESCNRGPGCSADLAGWRWSIPACAVADHAYLRLDWYVQRQFEDTFWPMTRVGIFTKPGCTAAR